MRTIVIHEVGLRDGLQIEKQPVPTERKLKWLDTLAASGVDLIQVGSFVHPAKVPQMADTDEIFRRLQQPGARKPGVAYTGLVLNEKGLERGLAVGVDYFCMGVSASETHSRKNTGMSTSDATDRIIAMAQQAVAAGTRVQVSVQSAFGCGFDGPIPETRVLDIVRRYADAGLLAISLADSSGHADPDQVTAMVERVVAINPRVEITAHFHNTYGLGVANVYAAWRAGVRVFEAGFGGLGGCPFVAKAAGNVSTEDAVHLFQRMNIRRDIDLAAIASVSNDASDFFGKPLPGTIHRTGAIPHGGRFARAAD